MSMFQMCFVRDRLGCWGWGYLSGRPIIFLLYFFSLAFIMFFFVDLMMNK